MTCPFLFIFREVTIVRLRKPYARKTKGKFGEWLCDSMDKYNMTQQDLSDTLRMHPVRMSQLQNCHRKPRYSEVMAMCLVFNDDPDRIWGFVKEDRK